MSYIKERQKLASIGLINISHFNSGIDCFFGGLFALFMEMAESGAWKCLYQEEEDIEECR